MIRTRRGKWLLWGGLVLLSIMLAAPIGLEALGRALIADDPLHQADAILVLSGESRKGDRVQRAVDLYKQGLAPLLVLSGTPAGFRTHEAEIMQRHAEYLGVPSDHILTVKHDADSTKEEAEAVVPILKAKGLKEVILVTSNYHTGRAKRIFAKAAGPAGPRFLASPTDDGLFNPDGWWMRRRHAKTFFFEATKTIWSVIEAE
ncbi:MAG TPA: YdcF family protein [Nitrospiraceae bacterium]|nr:YdcF family protein [Nitrospiraceae bacterium]